MTQPLLNIIISPVIFQLMTLIAMLLGIEKLVANYIEDLKLLICLSFVSGLTLPVSGQVLNPPPHPALFVLFYSLDAFAFLWFLAVFVFNGGWLRRLLTLSVLLFGLFVGFIFGSALPSI